MQIIQAGERRNLTESLNCLRLASLIRCRQAIRDIMSSFIHDQNQSMFLGSQFFSVDMIFLWIYVPHHFLLFSSWIPPPPPDRWLEVWLRMRYHYKSYQFQDVSNVVFIVAGRSVISEVSDWWMRNWCDVLLNLSAIGKLTWSLSYFTLMWQLKYVNCHSSILKLRSWIVSIIVWALYD